MNKYRYFDIRNIREIDKKLILLNIYDIYKNCLLFIGRFAAFELNCRNDFILRLLNLFSNICKNCLLFIDKLPRLCIRLFYVINLLL